MPRKYEGAGLLSVFNTIRNRYSQQFGPTTIRDIANVTGRFVKRGYSPAVGKWLKENAPGVVKSVTVKRNPLTTAFGIISNIATLGQWNKAVEKRGFDKLFHLALIVQYELNGEMKTATLEKNERVNFVPGTKGGVGETMSVPVPAGLTIGDMVERTEKSLGDNYFTYNAFNNNCQNFVFAMLRESGMLTPEVKEFILQPLADVIKEQPEYFNPFVATLTNLGAIGNQIVSGGDRRDRRGRVNH
jgi:hypothetical protein